MKKVTEESQAAYEADPNAVTSSPPPGEFARIISRALTESGILPFLCDCSICECTRRVAAEGDICLECQKGEHIFLGVEDDKQ